MTDQGNTKVLASHPLWDGRRILFDLSMGERSVQCAISLGALQDLGEQQCFKPADLLKRFISARHHIAAIALAKLDKRTQGAIGLLHIWSDDFDNLPPANAVQLRVPHH